MTKNIVNMGFSRRLLSSSEGVYKKPPSLDRPLNDFPKIKFSEPSTTVQAVQVSPLSNGLRVASQWRFGQFCTVGVLLESGSRFELPYPSGVSHFIKKLAFQSTTNYATHDEITQKFEKCGGISDCEGSRDTLIYASLIDPDYLEDAIHLLADVVFQPLFRDSEIDAARQAIRFEQHEMSIRQDNQDPIMLDLIHGAAFRDNTLGFPSLAPEANIDKIDRRHLYSFANNYHRPDRAVLCAIGVDHDRLVSVAERAFSPAPVWLGHADADRLPDLSVAQYTGGVAKLEKRTDESVRFGPTAMPELAHVALGFPAAGVGAAADCWSDYIACGVLQTLMGGGGSFSAGGPGKGMYSRLYLNVLNRVHWMYSCEAFYHPYKDAGLFNIQCRAPPSKLTETVDIMLQEFSKLRDTVSQTELDRAKKQLQSKLLTNLELTPVIFEDLGRQVLAGVRYTPADLIQHIDSVTAADVQRVAERMLTANPSLAALGPLRHLPEHERVRTALTSGSGLSTERSIRQRLAYPWLR